MIKFVGTLPLESIVDVKGLLVEANVKSCTQVRCRVLVGVMKRTTVPHVPCHVHGLSVPTVAIKCRGTGNERLARTGSRCSMSTKLHVGRSIDPE